MKKLYTIITLVFLSLTLISCNSKYLYVEEKINVTTTTNIIGDLVYQIGKEKVAVHNLMGSGVDPHGYVPRPSDYTALSKGDIIFTSGLNLEGKMGDVFASYAENKPVNSIGKSLIDSPVGYRLIENESFGGNYDPHFWFDIPLYKEAANIVANILINYDLENKEYYKTNLNNYLIELDNLYEQVIDLFNSLGNTPRILVSAHDAFSYFSLEYGFEVYALQGLSTQDEISPSDIREVSEIVVNNNVKAIFPETTLPIESIRALKEAVYSEAKYEVVIGNNLYSDSMGNSEDDNTYIKMYLKNVNSIVNALGGNNNE